MPCLTSCCCGFSVKAGTRAIAILSVVSDSVMKTASWLMLHWQVYSVLGLLMVGTFNLEKDRLLERQISGWPGPSNGNPSFHGVVDPNLGNLDGHIRGEQVELRDYDDIHSLSNEDLKKYEKQKSKWDNKLFYPPLQIIFQDWSWWCQYTPSVSLLISWCLSLSWRGSDWRSAGCSYPGWPGPRSASSSPRWPCSTPPTRSAASRDWAVLMIVLCCRPCPPSLTSSPPGSRSTASCVSTPTSRPFQRTEDGSEAAQCPASGWPHTPPRPPTWGRATSRRRSPPSRCHCLRTRPPLTSLQTAHPLMTRLLHTQAHLRTWR